MFVTPAGVDSTGVDSTGVDETGVDATGVDARIVFESLHLSSEQWLIFKTAVVEVVTTDLFGTTMEDFEFGQTNEGIT